MQYQQLLQLLQQQQNQFAIQLEKQKVSPAASRVASPSSSQYATSLSLSLIFFFFFFHIHLAFGMSGKGKTQSVFLQIKRLCHKVFRPCVPDPCARCRLSLHDDALYLLDDEEYPFPKFTVNESTVRPYPVMIIRWDGKKENLLVKAEPAPGYKFKMENHIAYYKPKDQSYLHRSVGDIIVFELLHVMEVGNAEGEPVQIDFSLYYIEGANSTLLARKRYAITLVSCHLEARLALWFSNAPLLVDLLPLLYSTIPNTFQRQASASSCRAGLQLETHPRSTPSVLSSSGRTTF
jgi:hypothetical protein